VKHNEDSEHLEVGRPELKLRELERDWGFDERVEIDDSWGAATMRAYGAYTSLLWVKDEIPRSSKYAEHKEFMKALPDDLTLTERDRKMLWRGWSARSQRQVEK